LQIIVAKILIDQGFVITNYYGLFGLYEVPWLLAQLSTVFVFLVVVNALNFIDGIDGLAITEVIKTLFLIEFFSEAPTSLFPLGSLVIASLLPLFYFNFKKKRKVFLGDGGSLFFGTLIMVYILYVLGTEYRFSPGNQVNKVFFSVLAVLYPLVDLLRVFILRIKDGKSPFVADQRHLHHKLLNNFKSPLIVILIIELISLGVFILV
jgi:UDP-N-acetylmuramyl pentapeptide phosphotransferase/UDP-N-acetylglucosamine-1-phosphate transferase